MSSTWGRPVSEAPPTGCSCHDPAGPGRQGGRGRRRARQRGLARYLGGGDGRMARNTTTPRRFSSGVRGAPPGYTELCESIAEFKRDLVGLTNLGGPPVIE